MTVSSSTNRWAYTGDGVTDTFAYTNRIYASTDLKVYVNAVLQTSGYSVSGIDVAAGGNVVFTTAPAADAAIVIDRDVPYTQPTLLEDTGKFPAANTMAAIDRVAILTQQLDAALSRTLRFPVTDTAPIDDLPSFATRFGKYLGFDSVTGAPTLFSSVIDLTSVTAEGGSAARALTQHFGDILSVKDFGALGDGATDDTAALQAAIDYCDANGLRLIVPKGTYPTGALTVDGAMHLELLKGATLKAKSTLNGNLIAVAGSNVRISGPGTIDGNRANVTASTGIGVSTGSSDVTIEDLTITSCKGRGIYASDNCPRLIVRRNYITDVSSDGAFLQLATNQSVHGVRVEDNVVDRSAEAAATIAGEGLKIWGGTSSNVLIGPVIRGNRVRYPASTTTGTLCIEIWFSKNASVSGNVAIGGTYGISHAQVHDSVITNSVCQGQSFIGLELAGSQRNVVNGVFCDGAQIGANIGISISAASGVNPTNNVVTGVSCKDVGRALYAVSANGLVVDGLDGKAYSSSGSADYYYVTLASTLGFSLANMYLDGNSVGNKGIFLDTSYKGTIAGVYARDWTQHSILLYAASAVTIDEIAISGCDLLNIGVTVSGGATLGANIRAVGNRVGSGNAYSCDFYDYLNFLTVQVGTVDPEGDIYAGPGSLYIKKGGGQGRQLYIKESGGTILAGGTNTGWRPLELAHSARIRLFDDFLGDTLDAKWGSQSGTDPQVVAPAFNAQTGGAMRMTTGDDAAGDMATNGVQLEQALVWRCANGKLVLEARVKMDAITNVAVFVGFTDQVGTLEMPFTLAAADALTSNATDAVGVLFDTNAATDNWWLVGVANDVDATKQNAGTAPTAATYETWRIEISTAGAATFWRNNAVVGTAMAAAVRNSVDLTPVVAAFSRSTASRVVDVDFLDVQAVR